MSDTMDRYFLTEMSSADGQFVGWDKGGGLGRVYINPKLVECIFSYPAYTPPKGWAKKDFYGLVTSGGRSFVVQMPPTVIQDYMTSSGNDFRHASIEHIGTSNAHHIKIVGLLEGWLNADFMEAAEDDINPNERYEDGIARVNVIGHSGFLYRVYGMQAHSIGTSNSWYYA